MTDTVDRETRSWIMSRVLSRGTKPELAVRKALRQAACRFSENASSMPGKPDFVIRHVKLAIFVNGCFWHWHGCARSRMPRANRVYWKKKIARNTHRDRRTKVALRKAGWHYWTIWECSLRNGIGRLLGKIRSLELQEITRRRSS